MLRSLLSGIFCTAALISSASAADLAASAVSYKDSPDLPLEVNWAGFYGGINGGYGWSSGNTTLDAYLQTGPWQGSFPEISYGKNGEFGGVQIGYNRQWRRFVYGLEADFQGSNIGGSSSSSRLVPTGLGPTVPATLALASSLDWFGTVRGRVGYTYGNALFYVTPGFAYGGVHATVSLAANGSQLGSVDRYGTTLGYVLGGGAEYALSRAWSIKAEYQYIDFKSRGVDISSASVGGSASSSQDYNTVRLGLNYRLLPGYDPLN